MEQPGPSTSESEQNTQHGTAGGTSVAAGGTSVAAGGTSAAAGGTSVAADIHGRQLYIIMGGVMLGLLLAALDQTVVGPAMFRIIRDLKGLEHYAWVTTAYLLTSTVTVPIAGKLGDLFGRKWYFVAGMVVFMIGSALSGLASGTQ